MSLSNMFRTICLSLLLLLVFPHSSYAAGGGGEGAEGEGGEKELKGITSLPKSVNLKDLDDVLLIAIMVFVLIGLTFIWEMSNVLSDYFCTKHNQMHLLAMRERLYSELTLVGIISLVLFLFEASNVFTSHIQHAFELVHLLIFLVLVFYILLTIFIALLSLRIYKRWERLEARNYDDVEAELKIAQEKRKENRLAHYLNVFSVIHYFRIRGAADYHIIRNQFIEQHQLSHHYKFVRYLKRCMRTVFSDMVSTPWTVVGTVLVIDLLMWLPFPFIGKYYGIPFLVLGLLVFFSSIIVLIKTRTILRTLVRNKHILIMPVVEEAEVSGNETVDEDEQKKEIEKRVADALERIGLKSQDDEVEKEEENKEKEDFNADRQDDGVRNRHEAHISNGIDNGIIIPSRGEETKIDIPDEDQVDETSSASSSTKTSKKKDHLRHSVETTRSSGRPPLVASDSKTAPPSTLAQSTSTMIVLPSESAKIPKDMRRKSMDRMRENPKSPQVAHPISKIQSTDSIPNSSSDQKRSKKAPPIHRHQHRSGRNNLRITEVSSTPPPVRKGSIQRDSKEKSAHFTSPSESMIRSSQRSLKTSPHASSSNGNGGVEPGREDQRDTTARRSFERTSSFPDRGAHQARHRNRLDAIREDEKSNASDSTRKGSRKWSFFNKNSKRDLNTDSNREEMNDMKNAKVRSRHGEHDDADPTFSTEYYAGNGTRVHEKHKGTDPTVDREMDESDSSLSDFDNDWSSESQSSWTSSSQESWISSEEIDEDDSAYERHYNKKRRDEAHDQIALSSGDENGRPSIVVGSKTSSKKNKVLKRKVHHRRHHHTRHHHRTHNGHMGLHYIQNKPELPIWIRKILIPLIKRDFTSLRGYFRNRTDHQDLFWFNSPRFLMFVIQILLYFHSTFLAINTVVIGYTFNDPDVGPFEFAGAAISIFSLIFLIPPIIYNYGITVNVGEFTKTQFMEEVIQKHHNVRYSKPQLSLHGTPTKEEEEKKGGPPLPQDIADAINKTFNTMLIGAGHAGNNRSPSMEIKSPV